MPKEADTKNTKDTDSPCNSQSLKLTPAAKPPVRANFYKFVTAA
jgi:hypothetical protein